jgi:hypothetical protein
VCVEITIVRVEITLVRVVIAENFFFAFLGGGGEGQLPLLTQTQFNKMFRWNTNQHNLARYSILKNAVQKSHTFPFI